jgi:hypothetical protein
MNIVEMAKALSGVVTKHISEALKPFLKRLSDLEARENVTLEQILPLIAVPKDGIDGKSFTIDEARPVLEEMVKAIEIPTPVNGVDGKDGRDGIDGKSFTIDEAIPVLEEMVKAIEIPTPVNGVDGKDGRDGIDGKSFTIDELLPVIQAALPDVVNDVVKEAILAIPSPDNGKDADIDQVIELIDQKFKNLPAPLTVEDVDAALTKRIDDFPIGRDGVDGKDGRDGIDGKSFTIDEAIPVLEEMVKAIEIPTPVNGVDGKDGRDGIDGVNGKDADLEIVEKTIQNGLNALETSLKAYIDQLFSAIPVPKDGKDVDTDVLKTTITHMVAAAVAAIPAPTNGKDALELEILPAIDLGKSYPRGVYAMHKGGLFRSFETTLQMRGWECLVRGVDSIGVDLANERDVMVTITLSDGQTVDKAMTVPAMVYRGVFKEGDLYRKGDTTTWGGSLWHCEEPTGDKPGETTSKGWKLCVKRGQDGRHGKDGRDLTKGVSIR